MLAYVARQAIYNQQKETFAYELLFRDGIKNCFPDISPDEATSSMIAGSHLSVGVENITANKIAFINFHQDTLLYRFPSTLNPLNVVIEIVESVEVTPELKQACMHISNLGYKIALDDYDFGSHWEPLMPLVNYIKLEVELVDLNNPAVIQKISDFKSKGIKLIAEKVETMEEFNRFKEAGFDYFQGYFLSVPEVVQHKNIEVSVNALIELVNISVSNDFDLDKIKEIFERDVGLSFKLMRFINNPSMNKRQSIDSLSHALKYLGQIEIKKFIALLALANLKGEKPKELVSISLARACFCKKISKEMGVPEDPPMGFVLGLFSLIDAFLDMPMSKVMSSLPFSDSIKNVLCENEKDSHLALLYQLCLAIERAEWKKIELVSQKLNVDSEEVLSNYYTSVDWANSMLASF